MPKFYYTDALRSLKDKNLYIGWSEDLVERVKSHNKGQVDATKYRLPMQLKEKNN